MIVMTNDDDDHIDDDGRLRDDAIDNRTSLSFVIDNNGRPKHTNSALSQLANIFYHSFVLFCIFNLFWRIIQKSISEYLNSMYR